MHVPGLTGTDIRNLLDGVLFLKALPNWADLEIPSDLALSTGVNDSVTRQYRPIRAEWIYAEGTLRLRRDAPGSGWWIPFLGNGMKPPRGVQITENQGLGTFACVPDVSPISWVATGPFSGCSTLSFAHPAPAGGRVFAHLATSGEGYQAASVAKQKADIEHFYAAPVGPAAQQVLWNAHEQGQEENLGYVFWMKDAGLWYRRVLFVARNGGEVRFKEDEAQL